MNKPVSRNAREAINSGRPSLYGSKPETPENVATFSILNGINPRRTRPTLTLRMAWVAPLMALAAVLLVAGLNTGFENIETFVTPSIPASIEVTAKDIATGPSPAAAASNVPPESASQTAVATIISEEPKVGALPVTAMVPALASLSEAQPAKPVMADDTVPAADTLIDATPGHTSVRPAPSDNKNASGKQTYLREAPANRKDRPQVAYAAAQSSKKNSGKDKDVDLIAALLTHVSSGSKTPTSGVSGKSSTNSTPIRTSSSTAAAKRERNPGTNRDIVMPAAGESTESLVKRCRALGFFEGELCRLRVCSGMWGKEPACPSNAASSTD